jgi:hypothetical protein
MAGIPDHHQIRVENGQKFRADSPLDHTETPGGKQGVELG